MFVMYLRCSSNESRTTNILFHALCLLYALSTVTAVCDLVGIVLQVSNNPICKKISIFFISCAVAYQYTIASTSSWLTANTLSPLYCPNHSNWWLWLHRPMYSSTHKPMYLSSVLFNLNLQRSTVVGSCGVKISVSWSFLHSWQSHT